MGETSYTTAGKVAKLVLTPDRATITNSRDDLSYVTVEAQDSNGVLVPDAAVPLRFSLGDGSVGEIAAVGNGDPQDIDSTQPDGTQALRTTWRGKAIAVLRPSLGAKGGKMTISVSAKGLDAVSATITTQD